MADRKKASDRLSDCRNREEGWSHCWKDLEASRSTARSSLPARPAQAVTGKQETENAHTQLSAPDAHPDAAAREAQILPSPARNSKRRDRGRGPGDATLCAHRRHRTRREGSTRMLHVSTGHTAPTPPPHLPPPDNVPRGEHLSRAKPVHRAPHLGVRGRKTTRPSVGPKPTT